jgi:Homeodomain-like domain
MGRPLSVFTLSEAEEETLRSLARRRTTAQALALRARIVLACAAGDANQVVAGKLGVTPQTVCKWRARFVAQRLDGLHDEPRPGVPRSIDDAKVEAVIVATLETMPQGATHWSSRGMARFHLQRPAYLARLRPAAAPYGNLQTVHRSAIRRQGARRRRPLYEPSRPCPGAVRR